MAIINSRDAFTGRHNMRKVELSDGSEVFIKRLSAAFVLNAQKEMQTGVKAEESGFGGARLFVESVVDEGGNRMFNDGDRDLIHQIDYADFSVVVVAIIEFNGLNKGAEKDGKGPDGAGEEEKNAAGEMVNPFGS